MYRATLQTSRSAWARRMPHLETHTYKHTHTNTQNLNSKKKIGKHGKIISWLQSLREAGSQNSKQISFKLQL